MGMFRITCFLFLFCVFTSVAAQENAHFESWNTFIARKYLQKQRFWYRMDLGIRPSFGDYPSTMFLLRPRIIISLANIVEFQPAVEFRYAYYPDLMNSVELRTWQGIRVHWPDVGRIMFDHFYRFEQRFHWLEGRQREDFSLRSRYRLNLRIPINKRSITDHTFFVDLRGEAFLPHDKRIQETYASTLRVGLNLGYRQNIKWRYELTAYGDGGKSTLDVNRSASRYMLEARVRTTF